MVLCTQVKMYVRDVCSLSISTTLMLSEYVFGLLRTTRFECEIFRNKCSFFDIRSSGASFHDILDLQQISWDKSDNVFRPRWLMPAIELIKYSFVLHHQHGQRASQELGLVQMSNFSCAESNV